MSLFRRPRVMMLLAVVLTIFVMMPGLKAPFFFDDEPNIVANPAIHIAVLNLDALKASLSGPSAGVLGRPISVLSFAITHYFFGLDAFAFKAINLGIHLINGLLVFWLLTILFKKILKTPHAALPAWIAAIWLIHPINFLPVMLSVQRMTLLSAFFMLLALISYLKFITGNNKKGIGWLCAGWLLFWPLSFFSKETGLLYPLYVAIITILLNTTSHKNHNNNEVKKILPWITLLLLLMAVGMMFYMGNNWLDNAYRMRPFSLTQRLMTEARVLWVYVWQIILPSYSSFALYHDDFLLSTSLIKPITTLVAIVSWIVIGVGVFFKWSRFPLLCFSLSWFFVGHLMESTFLPLEIMHEYRNYFPSIGLIIFIAYLAIFVANKFKIVFRPGLIVVVALLPIIILSFFTWLRANQLGNSLVGLQMEAAQHPMSARANYSAALALFKAGYGAGADVAAGEKIKELFERSGEADASFKLGYVGLIVWACASNRDVESIWVQKLSYRLQNESLSPGDATLAKDLFDVFSKMPTCLSRENIDRLFTSGGNNQKMAEIQRAYFFEYGADYMLLVFNDPSAAKAYLVKAMTVIPYTPRLEEKFNIINRASDNTIDKHDKK